MDSKDKIITSDDILGKDAVDPDGQILGVVTKLHINKETKQLVGITIDEGFMKPNLFLGMNFVKNFGVDSVFLSQIPTTKYVGLKVYDSEGKYVGTVKKVIPKRHKVLSIEITHNMKRYVITSGDIKEIGVSVILKENYKMDEL